MLLMVLIADVTIFSRTCSCFFSWLRMNSWNFLKSFLSWCSSCKREADLGEERGLVEGDSNVVGPSTEKCTLRS